MNKQDAALVKETKALIQEVEAGDSEHAAWLAIQDRVKRLYDGRTQAEVGDLLGKSLYWVADVVKWSSGSSSSPFAGSRASRRPKEKATIAKKVLADPEQRRKVIAELPDEALDAIRQDISEKESQEADGPDWEEKQRRRDERWQKWNQETEARKKVSHAYDDLRSRQHFFGEVPINDAEREELGWIIHVANYLLGNTELDDELKEILNAS